jgi:hypothetical protein
MIATYEDKVAHIETVARRGVEARRLLEEAGQRRCSRRRARRVFRAMGVKKNGERPGSTVLVLSDTPTDRERVRSFTEFVVSDQWAKHVRTVFVSSFVRGQAETGVGDDEVTSRSPQPSLNGALLRSRGAEPGA